MALFETFQDNFNDNSIDSSKWNNWGGAQVVETNQRLEITNPANDTNYHGVDAQVRYDLTGSFVHVELVDAGNQSLSSWEVMALELFLDSNNSIKFFITGGNIKIRRRIGGVQTDVSSIAYNATNHRWLRFRESGGTLYMEVSSDGVSWNAFRNESNPFSVTNLRADLLCGTYLNEIQTKAIWDNLNTPAAGGGGDTFTYIPQRMRMGMGR